MVLQNARNAGSFSSTYLNVFNTRRNEFLTSHYYAMSNMLVRRVAIKRCKSYNIANFLLMDNSVRGAPL